MFRRGNLQRMYLNIMRAFISLSILLLFALSASYCNKNTRPAEKMDLSHATDKEVKPVVTFIELGSVNCIPCKLMQPVMKNIEEKYAGKVKVVFYDVWTEEQKPYAQKYGIRLIPTQVFLDADGKEFHRHEGFYPEEEIDKIMNGKGLKPKNTKN